MEQPTFLCHHCPSVNSFKNRLNNHWASQELRIRLGSRTIRNGE